MDREEEAPAATDLTDNKEFVAKTAAAYIAVHKEARHELLGGDREHRIYVLQTIALTFPPGDIRRTELLDIADELQVEARLHANPDLVRRIEDAEAHPERRVARPADVTADLVDEHGIWDAAVMTLPWLPDAGDEA